MPDGVKISTAMVHNVYMASLAFLIHLKKIKMRYRKLQTSKQNLNTDFILYPNAVCRYWELEYWQFPHPVSKRTFYFKSKFNGTDSVIREIEVRPVLIELNLRKKQNIQYYIVFTISIDKVFGKKDEYDINDFCTEFDIVNLKKAIFENEDNGPFEDERLKGMRLSDWTTLIVNEIEGGKRHKIQLTNSIVDICTQQIDVTTKGNNINKVNEDFTKKYYNASNNSSIDDYFRQNIILQSKSGTSANTIVPERNFIYGLLYANDNFMMVNTATVDKTLGVYYSNNKVEKFWADDECIVHIKNNSPFYYSEKQDTQKLTGKLDEELPVLLDMCMLVYIKRRMQMFLSEHSNMSLQKVEYERGALTSLFCRKLFNQTEMDNRMDYFIKGFRLQRMFEETQRITNSTGNSKRLFSLRRINFWTLFIGISTLIVTIIGIIVSRKQ